MGRIAQTAKPNNPEFDVSSTVWNQFVLDYLSQTDTAAQALASDLNFAAGKRIKSDFHLFNPAATPAVAAEGQVYYDSTSDKLRLRNASAWEDISSQPYTIIDTAAALSAALTAGSSPLFLKPGTYAIDTAISTPADCDIVLHGLSQHATVIQASAAIDQLIYCADFHRFEVQNILFDCNGNADHGLEFTTGHNIEGLCPNILVRNCAFDEALDFAIFASTNLSTDTKMWVLDNCIQNTVGGISLGGNDGMFANNYISNLHAGASEFLAGIVVYGGSNIIRNNYLGGGAKHGICVYGSYDNLIMDNIIDYWVRHGVWIHGGARNKVSGNRISEMSLETDNTYNGVYLEGTTTYNQITDNMMVAPTGANDAKYAIYEAAAADNYNFIHGNIIVGGADWQTGTVVTQGANSVASDNAFA